MQIPGKVPNKADRKETEETCKIKVFNSEVVTHRKTYLFYGLNLNELCGWSLLFHAGKA